MFFFYCHTVIITLPAGWVSRIFGSLLAYKDISMNMKRNLLSLSFLAFFGVSGTALAAASAPAQNDSSTANLEFTGKVTSSLCQVSTSDLNQSIKLGEVSATALGNGGKSPAQSFTVTLNNCATNTGTINYVFSDTNGSPGTTSYLVPLAGDTSASGVGVYLEKSNGTAITIGQTNNIDVTKGADGTSALPQQSIPLKAYIGKINSSATVIPGDVTANAVMTIRTVESASP